MYFFSSPGGFLPPIIFAIVLLHVQPIFSQLAPIQMSEIPTQGISSRFRNFQQQTQHLTTLTNGTGRSNEINRRLASVLKRQSIFASLFDRSGGAGSGDILDLIFENVTQPHCEEHFRYALEQVFKSSTGIPETWVLQMFEAFVRDYENQRLLRNSLL
ncbi:unnamed protein product [Allacma fusca]|uniref:Uncharacterized protein n=1 Tax=Allacma fusca TaxID=39272 RepID=A0A8J2KL65_9HEXA|nr:unnamed protein product [Allacma fusca]